MKNRFTTIDVMAAVHDMKVLEGMSVNNIYDINSKTYLIRLKKDGLKAEILFESGIRIHRTNIDWPKAQFPSSFSMKMRKHVKQKRLESISQLGVDRVIDMRFGKEDRAVHVIVELYDRGNILLTDHDYVILNILRPRTDKDTDVKLSVKQTYPVNLVRTADEIPSAELVESSLKAAKKGENLRRLLAPLTHLGGPLIDHCLSTEGFPYNAQMLTHVQPDAETVSRIVRALSAGNEVYLEIREKPCKGYITYKEDERADGEKLHIFQGYYPYLFAQFIDGLHREYPSFSDAIDYLYRKLEQMKSVVPFCQEWETMDFNKVCSCYVELSPSCAWKTYHAVFIPLKLSVCHSADRLFIDRLCAKLNPLECYIKDHGLKENFAVLMKMFWRFRSFETFHLAVGCGFLKDVVALIEKDRSIVNKATLTEWYPTFIAAQFDQQNALGILLSSGANIKQTDKMGRTVVHWAAEYNSTVLESLLSAKGVKSCWDMLDIFGDTPLTAAINADNDVSVRLITAYTFPVFSTYSTIIIAFALIMAVLNWTNPSEIDIVEVWDNQTRLGH